MASYLSYKIYFRIKQRIIKKRKEKIQIENEKEYVGKFMQKDFRTFDSERLKSILKDYENRHFFECYPELDSKVDELRLYLEQQRRINEKMKGMELKEKRYVEEIRVLKEQSQRIFEHNRIEARSKESILRNLKVKEKHKRVFKKRDLNKKEIKILIEEGFKSSTEYCCYEKRHIAVLIKSYGNHKESHEFLVWSIKKLLK